MFYFFGTDFTDYTDFFFLFAKKLQAPKMNHGGHKSFSFFLLFGRVFKLQNGEAQLYRRFRIGCFQVVIQELSNHLSTFKHQDFLLAYLGVRLSLLSLLGMTDFSFFGTDYTDFGLRESAILFPESKFGICLLLDIQ